MKKIQGFTCVAATTLVKDSLTVSIMLCTSSVTIVPESGWTSRKVSETYNQGQKKNILSLKKHEK